MNVVDGLSVNTRVPQVKLHLVAAVSRQTGAIGFKGTLPWYKADDLRMFKLVTMNSVLIVGQRTAKHLPDLPGRTLRLWDGKQLPSALLSQLWYEEGISTAWLIGGAHTYRSFAHHVNGNIVINYVDYDGPFDTVFPFDAYNIPSPTNVNERSGNHHERIAQG
ncbi:dihydrofolate reductase protein [Rhizobium phage RHph_I42]|nr:dihydrofolate reductase protein [Rhizobium phage RHph_I42]